MVEGGQIVIEYLVWKILIWLIWSIDNTLALWLSKHLCNVLIFLQVNKMTLEERHGSSSSNSSDDSSDGSFIIKSTDPRRSPLWFVCHAHSPESRTEWLQNLRQILQTQRDFLKAIQSPIAYQKELTKEAS